MLTGYVLHNFFIKIKQQQQQQQWQRPRRRRRQQQQQQQQQHICRTRNKCNREVWLMISVHTSCCLSNEHCAMQEP